MYSSLSLLITINLFSFFPFINGLIVIIYDYLILDMKGGQLKCWVYK